MFVNGLFILVAVLVAGVGLSSKVETEGVSDLLKKVQGLHCLPYPIPGVGATVCYKFAGTTDLADSVVARSVDNVAGLAYASLNGCKQNWRTEKLKDVMCKRHTGESWFLKMQKSSTEAHKKCSLSQAKSFVDRTCQGRKRPSKLSLLQMAARQRAEVGTGLKVFRLSKAEHERMFGIGDKFGSNEVLQQVFQAVGIPVGLKLQVGLNHKNPDKELGRVAGFNPIFTKSLGSAPKGGYCVSMLDLLTFMVGGGVATPMNQVFKMLSKYSGGYWNYPGYIKSMGKYCIAWDAVADGDILKGEFKKASLQMVQSANLNLPGLFGLWKPIGPYKLPSSPIFSFDIVRNPETNALSLNWDRMKIPNAPPAVWQNVAKSMKKALSLFTKRSTSGILTAPRELISENSLCKQMWSSSHCQKCEASIHPFVTKYETIFKEAKPGTMSWHVVMNKKAEEDLIQGLETEGYEVCIAKEEVSNCHCGKGITQEDVDYCNGDIVRMLVETKEKKLPLDQTEVGKIFKELASKPEGGDGEPLFMGVMLRIGELYRTPYFKRHPSKIRKQICHETSCGCKSAMAEAQAFEKNEVERVQAKSTNGKGMLQNNEGF